MTNHHESSPGESGMFGHTPARTSSTEPMGLKRRHFMGTALALDAAALLAACGGGGGGGGGGTGSTGLSGSGSASGSSSGSGSSSSSGSGLSSGSGSGSGSGSAALTNWVVSTIAGDTGATTPVINGTGGTATFSTPTGICVDASGQVYVADFNNHLIRHISPAGVVSTLAAIGAPGFVNGMSATAKFNNPRGVAVDTAGNVYVADFTNHVIRKTTFAGVVSTFAGVGGANGSLDGSSGTAKFYNPSGVAVDTGGNVYVADYNNHLIRKISPAGVVSTLAGVASQLGFVDGASGTAKFYSPYGISVDSSGNVYVADQLNHRIRMINLAGVVSTVAGTGFVGSIGANNGTGGTAAFNYPTGVAVDNSNNLYVADNLSNQIRKITPIY